MVNKLARLYNLCKKRKLLLIKYKIINELHKLFFKKELFPPFPLWVLIEPTNICNLQCPICYSASSKMQRPKRMMSLEEFKKIIDDVKGFTEKVFLFNNGEPFLNKDILKMIEYAVSANMAVTISTNGHFFESKVFVSELIKSGLNNLIVSVDGKDQETYGVYRRGGSLAKVIKGLRLISQTKKELKSETPKVELQFLLMKHNEHQRADMRLLAKEWGADVYSEKTINLFTTDLIDDPDSQNLLKEFLPLNPTLSRFCFSKYGKLDFKGEVLNDCLWLNKSTVINSDGTVIPCCFDNLSRHIMGNVFETPLGDIWKGKSYQDLRLEIKKNRINIQVCNGCCICRNEEIPFRERYDL